MYAFFLRMSMCLCCDVCMYVSPLLCACILMFMSVYVCCVCVLCMCVLLVCAYLSYCLCLIMWFAPVVLGMRVCSFMFVFCFFYVCLSSCVAFVSLIMYVCFVLLCASDA